MFPALIGTLLSTIVGGVVDHFKSKQELKKAETEGKIARLRKQVEGDIEWDLIQAANANSSWKDEWFAIIVSIPLIMAFIPSCVDYVRDGFRVLSLCPDWYKALVGGAVAASFGLKQLVSFWRR